eukprot:CAMPEP_0206534032 /NCGR_PEP_ID=MMETSP0325_2-20121206/5311_1 /ASSEMBLY_ACC=CAM_ASM_000347 /TAXON_ID=2866 /ORGANISM="Crypthecodinium cohnii, Strain Seligo" /LENGTH=47 /DNA_ID= /DNA_START= /DNA_END= /DNA_ORIENTATION=
MSIYRCPDDCVQALGTANVAVAKHEKPHEDQGSGDCPIDHPPEPNFR